MAIPHDSFTLGLLATGTAQGGRYAGFVALIFFEHDWVIAGYWQPVNRIVLRRRDSALRP